MLLFVKKMCFLRGQKKVQKTWRAKAKYREVYMYVHMNTYTAHMYSRCVFRFMEKVQQLKKKQETMSFTD